MMKSLLRTPTASRPVAVGATKKTTQKTGTKRTSAAPTQDALWLPNTERPEWLDGSLPGDRGFDPLGLSKPGEAVLIGVDDNDINAAFNAKGTVEAIVSKVVDVVEPTPFAPYSEVFGIQRFRENELIHGRWAMLACLGVFVGEGTTGVSWVDAGKVELDASTWAGLPLPFDITQLIWIEALLVGGAEVYRNAELDPELRVYPGGPFDPLGLAGPNADPEKVFALKNAEIKHGRLAMIAFLGFVVQAGVNDGAGALGSAAKFAASL
ncbi:hypothetical protein FOA52_001559 [Chlamydomonas sp. UWO 241]|nr:hypothetical protein FOA52_001559 [Chlamydomonas sp. UWO 241]